MAFQNFQQDARACVCVCVNLFCVDRKACADGDLFICLMSCHEAVFCAYYGYDHIGI